MSFTKKTWTDRISEYPTRRTLTKEDGTTETVTVTRAEGTISQEGDAYSAANMNDLEQRVADGFSTLSQDSVKIATKNTTSDSIAFGIDSNGNYGYIKEGADTVTPFKSQKDIDNAYNSGVSAADARVNFSSASYNQGVSDADNRVNTSSASYNSGYTNGHNQGVNDGINSVNIDFFCLWAFESNASNWQGHGYSLRNSLNKNGGNIVSVGSFGWYNDGGGNTRHGELIAKVNCTVVSNKGTWNLNAGQHFAVSICNGNNGSGQWEGYAYAR